MTVRVVGIQPETSPIKICSRLKFRNVLQNESESIGLTVIETVPAIEAQQAAPKVEANLGLIGESRITSGRVWLNGVGNQDDVVAITQNNTEWVSLELPGVPGAI